MALSQSYALASIDDRGAVDGHLHTSGDDVPSDPHLSREYQEDHDERGVPPRLASVEQKRKLWIRNSLINASFIFSWYLFATILSLYNKWMLAPEHFDFPYPLFVTTMHMIVQFLMAAAARTLFPNTMRSPGRPNKKQYGQQLVPCGMATGLDIGLSNLSLRLVTLSFYTMCKSSSLGFVLLFAFAFRLEKPSLFLVAVILVVTLGVMLMVFAETRFVWSGAVLVLSASAFGGLRWSLTQVLLKKREMGLDRPASTVFWLAPTMAVTLFIVSAIFEGLGNVLSSHYFHGPEMLKTLLLLTAPGSIAFLMVLSEFYIIKRAGVVPMSLAGIFKEVSTISLSTFIFGDHLTPINMTGLAVTTLGIGLYTVHKYRTSIQSELKLDPHGIPIEEENTQPEGEMLLDEEAPSQDVVGEAGWADERGTRSTDVEVVFSAGDGDARMSGSSWTDRWSHSQSGDYDRR